MNSCGRRCPSWSTPTQTDCSHFLEEGSQFRRVERASGAELAAFLKEVHAADVAKAVGILLKADGIAGEAYNCYDRYVSEFDVATLAKELSGSESQVVGGPMQPKHQIVTDKIRGLGIQFGGDELLRQTVAELVAANTG